PSLKLLQLLMTSLKNQALFVIGAYRDNEVNEAHPLMLTLADIKQGGGTINTITLAPLEFPTVNQWVADVVHTALEPAQALTELVYTKTQGNPFFLGEFLKSLHDEKLLTFNIQRGTWKWDLEQIKIRDITDNVIVLMTGKIKRLAEETQHILKLAACIGNQFDLHTLAIVCQKSPAVTANDLWPALIEGLVLPLDENYKVVRLDIEGLDVVASYKFAHDRVQQAVYSLIPDDNKQIVHLEVGHLLLHNTAGDTQKEERTLHIFDIARHLGIGRELITDSGERDQLANEIYLVAGKKAKASAAYKPAFEYFSIGLELLGTDGWQRQYATILDFYNETAESAYLIGDFDKMEELIHVVLNQAHATLDKVRVYQIRVQAEIAKNKPEDGIKAAREALLQMFGIAFPEKPTQADAEQSLAETKALWEQRGIEDLFNLSVMTDPQILAVVYILQKMYFVSYVVDPRLYIVVVCKLIALSIQHGNSPLSSTEGYIQYALILCGVGDIENGYKSGKLAWKLVQHFDVKAIASTVGCIFNGAVRVWVEPLKETLKDLLEAYHTGENTGNLMFATLSLSFYANHIYWLGMDLVTVEREIAKYNEVLRNLKQEMFIDILDVYQQSALNLLGKTPPHSSGAENTPRLTKEEVVTLHLFKGPVYDEATRLPIHLETKNSYSLAHLYLNKVVMCYLFEEFAPAADHAHKGGQEYIGNVQGQGSVPVFNFYDSLSKLAKIRLDHPKFDQENERGILLEKVTANQVLMKKWADHAPANYAHKHALVQAEISHITGNFLETRDLFDHAVTLAVNSGYLQDEALANELAARFYLNRNQKHVARHYLRDAIYAYLRWGAVAKVQQLEQKYPDLLAQTTMTAMVTNPLSTLSTFSTLSTLATRTQHSFGGYGALDFMSVLKASQVLSGNIVLDKLLSDLMRIIIENAGAEYGYLILEKRGQWFIEAEGHVGQAQITVLQSVPLVPTNLPLSVINYVNNTQESVVLNNAAHEGDFTKDSYILNRQPKSVLCFPLLNQGKLQGILYLENNLITSAFTPDRIQILGLLSIQAAISIENARLYGYQVELTDSYSRFVPIEYLKFLQKEHIMDVQLGDHVAKEMAVLFSDIRSFTTLSENMTPQENFNFVNAYLKRVSPKIRDNSGFIVKYLGDGMMAVFPNGADDALRAGVAKLRAVELYNFERLREGRQPIKVGIGIHVGRMMVGMVGETGRMQGDAFSDNVNLTARLESLTKFYGVSLVLSEEALKNLEDPTCYQTRFLDRVIVVGRTEPIAIYEVLDGEEERVMNFKLTTQAHFEKGVRCYQAADLSKAKFHFNEVLQVYSEDKAAVLYMGRINRFMEQGVPANWDGVSSLTEK
ncbi:MAG: hypothetical protein BWK79_18365, partial [Beggiatoa sp. IS2]